MVQILKSISIRNFTHYYLFCVLSSSSLARLDISKLNIMGIEATKLTLRENHIFILDSVNGQVITPSNQNIQETIKRK